MTAVIFISDGDPTFYYNPDGYTREMAITMAMAEQII